MFLRSDAQDADALGTAEAAEEAGIDVCVLSRELFSRITDARTPQCIAAEAYKPDEPDLSALPEGANVLVLDRLQDPGNVGTLIRTSEAMGFSAAVLVKGTADPWQPKAVRSAAGSLLRLPVIHCESAADAAEMLHEMATVGVSMAALVTVVWLGMVGISAIIEKRAPKSETAEA